MKRNWVPSLVLDPVRESLVSSSGGLLLRQAIGVSGVERMLSAALSPWRSPRATHDPAKVLVDVAAAVALGGDCLADLAVVRSQPEVFGPVASDPTVSRLVATLAADIEVALPAIRTARAQARDTVWARRRPLAGIAGSRDGCQVVVDLDSTLVTAHSDKENAQPTHKRTFGFSPMCAFVDHGEHGTGETLVAQLRPEKASPWDKQDHIEALDLALAQLPEHERGQVLVRADSGGCSKAFLHHVTDAGLAYSIGFPAHETVKTAVEAIPAQAWRAAIDGDGEPRDGAQVAELTAWMPDPVKATRPGPQHWPSGMRVIARRERPHPGAQLRLTDPDGWRITCFATNTSGPGWTLAALEVRHRQRARAEDRIRALKDTGMRNLPFHGYAQNQIWLEIVALAADLLAWVGILKPWPGTTTSPPDVGNPNDSGSGSWPSQDASSEPDVEDAYDYPETGHGTGSSRPAGPPSAPPDIATRPDDKGTGEPATPSAGEIARPHPTKRPRTEPIAHPAGSRNIEASKSGARSAGLGIHRVHGPPRLPAKPICAHTSAS